MNYAKKNITGPAKRYYQPGAEAKALNGYDQLNSLLKKKYISKAATEGHGYHFADAQVQIVNQLQKSKVS